MRWISRGVHIERMLAAAFENIEHHFDHGLERIVRGHLGNEPIGSPSSGWSGAISITPSVP